MPWSSPDPPRTPARIGRVTALFSAPGYHRYEDASLSLNHDGAAFATWRAGGLYGIPTFSTRAGSGTGWRWSGPMYSPSSYLLSAAVESTGRTVAIYADDGTEGLLGTYLIAGRAGSRGWSKERKVFSGEASTSHGCGSRRVIMCAPRTWARKRPCLMRRPRAGTWHC